MSPQSSAPVQRTAPIAIAPKPPRPEPSAYRQDSFHRLEMGHGAASSAPLEVSSFNGSPIPPCLACRYSRASCIVNDDDDGCVQCQAAGSECSLACSPQSRKRKLHGEVGQDVIGKRSTAASSSFLEEMANVGGPTMLKRTLGLQDDRYSQYIGPTTDFEPSLINLSSFDPHDESLLSRGTLRKVSEHDTFLMLPDSSTPGHEHVRQDADHVESIVAPHGRHLIDIYFRVIHPGFPIIQKHVFMEKYERSHREFSPPLLAAVYILAINWWDQSEDLAGLPRPNVKELESIIRATLDEATFRPKLSTIQAGLLLSQRPEGDQWAPTAQLVALGHELGLHLDCTGWKIPPWEKGLRKRLAWALYMQDKWGALVHGRPSHIFSTNWGVQALTPNDFPDVEWDENDGEEKLDVERGRMLFMRVVQLSEILSEILDTFYTLHAMNTVTNAGPQGTHLVLSLAKPIQLKLKEWYGGLPQLIRLDSSYSSLNPTPNRLSSIGYLHLAYFAAEITLHRRIIRSLATASNAVDPYVQHICRSAAKARLISAMDFVNRLTPNHLRSFWYFASKTNFALIGTFGSLLWATSPGREEADWYRRRLGEYRWTLSVSSKPGEGKSLTEFAMTMLDISTGLLKQLPEKPSMSRNGSHVDLSASAPPSFSGGILDSLSSIPSADISAMHSPGSEEEESSDDDMEDYPTRM
ncbi:DAL81-transcriptional activator [Fusarium albosuccineum]|uniref:DAL81-transcriptional activator n=1 Tax=Fusarium albosuccineum TaxID=1237068 RepID=A0A8H4L237_9HYPO|nr:DAL81-transcriptional activator [Fusarium albosuccineum]